MGYELGITEIGPAEYPLLEVLRETIFSEFGHRSLSTLAEDLEGQQDVLALIAHLEGNPVGFKVGHRDRKGVYYSKCGGVLRDYRRLGLALKMQDWQHRFARARGYQEVYFNTFNHFRDMILLGLRTGFVPFAAERRDLGGMSFRFSLKLTEDISPLEKALGKMPTASAIEVDHRDRARLIEAVSSGYQLNGIRHDFAAGRTFIALARPAV
jgi:hypothetical protein